MSKSHTQCRDDKEQEVDMTAATGSPSTHQACPLHGQHELLRQPAMLSSACPFPCSGLGGKSNLIHWWHCAQRQGLCFACGPLQLHRRITSPEEPRKKSDPKLGLHVTPMRDFCPPMLLLSSSSMLAPETLILRHSTS